MQVFIWVVSVLGVIGAGIGLGLLLYFLFWQKDAIKYEESVPRKEFEEFKAAIEAKLQEALSKGSELDALRSAIESVEGKLKEGVIKPSELDALRSAIGSVETKLQKGLVKPSELDKLKAVLQAIEAKLKEEYVTQSNFNRFKEAIKEIM